MNWNEVEKLFKKAENLIDFPGEYFPALQEAKTAKGQWRKEHPEEAAKADEEHKAIIEAERRRKENTPFSPWM